MKRIVSVMISGESADGPDPAIQFSFSGPVDSDFEKSAAFAAEDGGTHDGD